MTANLESIAGWALRTSIEALPLALLALALVRCRAFQATWRIWLLGFFFLRLTLPAVPQMQWRASWWTDLAPATANHRVEQREATLPGGALLDEPVASAVSWSAVGAWVWGIGAASVLGWLAVSHFLIRRRIVRERLPAPSWLVSLADWGRQGQGVAHSVRVYMHPRLTTMAVFGWLRPSVLVPADLEERYTSEQIRGMMLHEMAHVRRHDVLWSWVALVLCALHWFNPLAWLAFRRFCADRELICDASALECLTREERISYGDALLRSLHVAPLPAVASLAPFFRIHSEIRHRILMITKPVPPTAWSRFAAATLVPGIVLLGFTTGRAENEPIEQPKPAPEQRESLGSERERPAAAGREGDRPRLAERDGDRPRTGSRDGEARKRGPRDGEGKKQGLRDGELKKDGPRDGERPKAGTRDGDRTRGAERDADRPRQRGREGDMKREGARDGNRARRSAEREGDRPRDGDRRKEGARDGDRPKLGNRDGEREGRGPRDGEAGTRKGPRDGERAREGDASPDSGAPRREGDKRGD